MSWVCVESGADPATINLVKENNMSKTGMIHKDFEAAAKEIGEVFKKHNVSGLVRMDVAHCLGELKAEIFETMDDYGYFIDDNEEENFVRSAKDKFILLFEGK